MSGEIQVPTLGESIVDAVIAGWLKHEGDSVSQGEALVELETDKVNVEVTAEQSGVLQKIVKHEGDTVSVGEVLGVIGEGVQVSAPEAAGNGQAAPAGQPPVSETAGNGQTARRVKHLPPRQRAASKKGHLLGSYLLYRYQVMDKDPLLHWLAALPLRMM